MPKWAADFQEGRMRFPVRRYKNPNRHDGQYVYRSVTNVTGALPKVALLNWYSKTTAETAVHQRDVWQKMDTEEEQIDWLKHSPDRNRDRAAGQGSGVHSVIENMLQGKTYDMEADIDRQRSITPWLPGVVQFYHDARPRKARTETSVYDERTFCAGTFDFLGRLDSAPELGLCLIDWKTGKGIYEDMAVQLVGGYVLGTQYILNDEGEEIEWREPDTAMLVHFTHKGYDIHIVPKDKQLRRAFLGALEIRKWEEQPDVIEKPYQLRLDLDGPQFSHMPSTSELDHLRSRLKQLDHVKQLQLSTHAHDLGIETNIKRMTVSDYDKLLGLLSLYESGEQADDKPSTPRRPRRPMP
jgi:hypothetical protein